MWCPPLQYTGILSTKIHKSTPQCWWWESNQCCGHPTYCLSKYLALESNLQERNTSASSLLSTATSGRWCHPHSNEQKLSIPYLGPPHTWYLTCLAMNSQVITLSSILSDYLDLCMAIHILFKKIPNISCLAMNSQFTCYTSIYNEMDLLTTVTNWHTSFSIQASAHVSLEYIISILTTEKKDKIPMFMTNAINMECFMKT